MYVRVALGFDVNYLVNLKFYFVSNFKAFMKLDKTKYEDDKMDQQKEEEERLLIVMVTDQHQTSLFNAI